MLFYRAALPFSSRTLAYVSGVIRRHRVAAGSRWRKLNQGKQALLVLVKAIAPGDVGTPPGGIMGREESVVRQHTSIAQPCAT